MVGAYKQTGNGSFRPGTSFRPSEIVRRIIGLQSIFYLSLFVQIFALKLFFGYIFGFVDIPLCSVVYPSSSELGVFRYLLVFVSQDSSSLIVYVFFLTLVY